MPQERRNDDEEVRVIPENKKNRMRSRQLLRDIVGNGSIDMEAIEAMNDLDEE